MSEENENIENFLRKGLAGKEFQFREEDWNKLEPRLNAEFPVNGTTGMSTVKWIVLSALLVVVSFFSGWFLNSRLADDATVPGVVAQNPESSTLQENQNAAMHQDEPETAVAADPQLRAETDKRTPAVESASTAGTFKKIQSAEPVQENKTSQTPGVLASRMLVPAVKLSVPAFKEVMESPAYVQNLVMALDRPLKTGETRQQEVLPAQGIPHHRLAAGAALSPDFSSTSPAPKFNELGKAYGLFIEYQPFGKWRFSTGVFKADKVYSAGEGDYKPPLYSGWPDSEEPIRTDAACNVLDIPLTAGFKLLEIGRKSSFWLNGGISSYWMLSERYDYHYENYDGYRLDGWQGANENRHPFGVVSVSVSFETFVAERLSVKVEPFFKVPLSGVGYGKVTLFTSGSWLAVRYHFFKNSGNSSVPR